MTPLIICTAVQTDSKTGSGSRQFKTNSIIFTIESRDGEGGYPGDIAASVRITLEGALLSYEYSASVNRPTYVDMTNHTYFSLDNSGSILDHELVVAAQSFAAVDDALIPTGNLLNVDQTPFDFRVPRTLRHGIDQRHPQLQLGKGYDHSYLLDGGSRDGDRPDSATQSVATLYSPQSRIEMQISTTAPALQLYSGNFLDKPHSALCLETQHLSNACNQSGFQAPLATPAQAYFSQTYFGFRTRAL